MLVRFIWRLLLLASAALCAHGVRLLFPVYCAGTTDATGKRRFPAPKSNTGSISNGGKP